MNTKTTPKDFFLHLGATIALYSAAVALMNLAFSIIDRALPDTLQNYWSASSIVWPVSMLIVLVPLLYVLEWTVRRDIVKMPEKSEVWIRRWRIYLTLFLTGATIAGDLIALINTYLNGEITSRFVYKVFVVFVVSGVVFTYYLLSKATDFGRVRTWRRSLAIVGLVIVVASIVGGFIIVGSPAKQRALRFDQQRVNDLTSVQYSIARYWQENGNVPSALSILPEYVSAIPKDPVTQTPYRYEVGQQSGSFRLCATFSAPDTDGSNPADLSPAYRSAFDNWRHGAGEVCFNRVISPVDFPPIPRSGPAQIQTKI